MLLLCFVKWYLKHFIQKHTCDIFDFGDQFYFNTSVLSAILLYFETNIVENQASLLPEFVDSLC
jgi:hypothetical protein